MKIEIRHPENEEIVSLRIKVKDKEYLIKEIPEGLQIIECSNDKEMLVRPHSGNAIILK